jgi:HSP20 family protein
MRHLILKPSNNNVRPLLFDNFFDSFFENSFQNDFSPKVDISETDKVFNFEFAVPGINKTDLSIEIKNGYLTVSGERRINNNDNNFHSIENGYGKFSRSFQLPDNIDENKISAKHKNGILNISIEKDAKTSMNKTIQIK